MDNNINLSKTEKKVYNYIIKYVIEHMYPPTMREIGEAVGLKSTSSVSFCLDKLESTGLIALDKDNGARAIKLNEYKIIKQ